MLGPAQEAWLSEGFRLPRARWNVLAQQVMMMRRDNDPEAGGVSYHMDKWDGAAAARQRLFDGLTQARIANAIVLTGDIHQNWAGELKANFDDPKSATVGVEFIATSITSGGGLSNPRAPYSSSRWVNLRMKSVWSTGRRPIRPLFPSSVWLTKMSRNRSASGSSAVPSR